MKSFEISLINCPELEISCLSFSVTLLPVFRHIIRIAFAIHAGSSLALVILAIQLVH